MENKSFITAEHLSFGYQNEEGKTLELALQDLSVSIGAGELVAVLGHNGSGKSTLAKHFNAILLPQGGVCYVDGMDTREDSHLYDIRQRVGMVFQNPDNQIVATIVEEDVAFALENMGVPPQEIRQRVDAALRSVGMYEYREHAPHLLSGGQKQRVAIAGVIAMRPRCIVLDEPTAMLDPRGRREVMNTIRRLNAEDGVTVVLITHYMDEAAQCRRVLVVDRGHLLMDAPPQEVFSHTGELKAVGLDVPQAAELCHLLREDGYDIPGQIIGEEACIQALTTLLESHGIKAQK